MAISGDDTFRRAVAALQAGKINDAEFSFKALLQAQPRHVGALNLLSILLTQRGKLEEAEHFVQRALNENAKSDATFYNYGIILKALNRPDEALQRFSQALAINPATAETWNNRGTVFSEMNRYNEAIADFDKAIAINSKYAGAHYNKAKALAELKLYDQSLDAYDRALSSEPNLAEALCGRGGVLLKLKQHDDALAAYDKAVALAPDLAAAWVERGIVFSELDRYAEAFASFDRALTLKPDLAEAWLGRGNVFLGLRQYNEAAAAYDRALTLEPELAEAWLGLGSAFVKRAQYSDALVSYDKALAIRPDLKYVEGIRLETKLQLCDWTNYDLEVAHLLAAIKNQKLASMPLANLSMPTSAADQFQFAKRYVADQPSFPAIWRDESYSHDRVRIAYVSADFREHPVGRQMAGLFEAHDKSRFEMTAISLGVDKESETRARIQAAFEHFIDVQSQDDQKIAELLRGCEIDIAVDLNGFTDGGRLGVFARRPAPIQVNYFGYSGTLGTDYFDYILADRTVIPEDQFQFYSEKVAWLPDSFMASDSRRQISEYTPTRRECGLPESALVFCCFNNTYKIVPDLFDIWMRLLKATAGSVLWLLEGHSTVSANLRSEAEKRGVSPERLIYAPRIPLADHVARHRLADLFLDTLPYNAHTTASDALWAGLPVLTCLGSTFAGRVAGSLVKAIGMAELITASLDDYEALALKLAQNPSLLASSKDKLARNLKTYPLFNTELFARHIEAAYTLMWERHRRDEPPAPFAVEPIA